MPGSYPHDYLTGNDRAATNIGRALLSMSITPHCHEDDLVRSSQENGRRSSESSRKADFGGIVAHLIRRSPSPERGRGTGHCGSASERNTSPSKDRRKGLGRTRSPSMRNGCFDGEKIDDEEGKQEEEEIPRSVRKVGSLRGLKDALDSAIRWRGKVGSRRTEGDEKEP